MELQANGAHNRRVRNVISGILSFLLCLFLSLLALLVLVQSTLLSPGFMKKQVAKSEYAAHIIEDMEEIFVSYGISSDFDEAFFTSVLSESGVRADIEREIDRMYGAALGGADVDGFKNQLHQKLLANVGSRGIEVTDEVEDALQYLVQVCAETYQEGVSLPLATYASGMLRSVKTPLLMATGGIALLSVFILAFLFFIRRKKTFCRFAIYAFSGSALTLAAGACLVLFSGRIERISISSKALYYLVTTYATQCIYFLLMLAGILLALTALFAVLYVFFGRREKRPRRHGKQYYLIDVE